MKACEHFFNISVVNTTCNDGSIYQYTHTTIPCITTGVKNNIMYACMTINTCPNLDESETHTRTSVEIWHSE